MNNISSKIRVKKRISPMKSPLSNKYKEFISSGGKVKRKVLSPNDHSRRRNKVSVIKIEKVEGKKVDKGTKEKVKDKGTKEKVKEKKVDRGVNPEKKVDKVKDNSKRKTSGRRQLNKRHTKSRRVSLKCTPRKKKNIDKVFKSLEIMSDDEIKKELLNKGIEFKSNNKKLLKDIYLFSSLGGIKVHRE